MRTRAQQALLTTAAGLARPYLRGRPSRVAKFAEDLTQLVVDRFEDRRALGQVHVIKRGKPLDGRVDAGVTGGGESRP